MVAKFVGSFGLMRYSSLESQSVEAIPPATPKRSPRSTRPIPLQRTIKATSRRVAPRAVRIPAGPEHEIKGLEVLLSMGQIEGRDDVGARP